MSIWWFNIQLKVSTSKATTAYWKKQIKSFFYSLKTKQQCQNIIKHCIYTSLSNLLIFFFYKKLICEIILQYLMINYCFRSGSAGSGFQGPLLVLETIIYMTTKKDNLNCLFDWIKYLKRVEK